MCRTWRSPIMPASAASAGIAFFTALDEATSAWRTIAPAVTELPSAFSVFRSASAFRSMRSVGEDRRSFIACTRLCPPARYLPSLFCAPSESASFMAAGRWYWKACMVSLSLGGFVESAPHGLRRGGHRQVLHAERVGDGIHERGRRADSAGLAAALHAQRVVRA